MAKATERITANVTPAQKAAAEAALAKETAETNAGTISLSARMKQLLADYCAAWGVEFPTDESGWGGRRKNAGAKPNRP